MIQFNKETRQFSSNFLNTLKRTGREGIASVRDAKTSTWGHAAGIGNLALNKIKRHKLEQAYLKEGKDPVEAKKLAKKQTDGTVKSLLKGEVAGRVVKSVGNKVGLTKSTIGDKATLAQRNLRQAKQAHELATSANKTAHNMQSINALTKDLNKATNKLNRQTKRLIK